MISPRMGPIEGLDDFVAEIRAETLRDAKVEVLAGSLMMEKAIKENLTGARSGRVYTVARSTAAAMSPVRLLSGRVVTGFRSPPRRHRAASKAEAPGVLSGRLRTSISSTNPKIEGDAVRSEYGTNVEYAAIHEYGGTVRNPNTGATVRIPARPYVRPAEEATHPRIDRRWRKNLA